MKVIYTIKFSKIFNKLDSRYKKRIEKLIEKIVFNPEIGKPMKYDRFGSRELYLDSFRLSYNYDKESGIITIVNFYHKKYQ